MMSGTFGKPIKRIQQSFEKRYCVNFFGNLFEGIPVGLFLSKSGIEQVATLGKKSNKTCSWKVHKNTEGIKQYNEFGI